jgi:hypothetical protein
MQTERIGRGGTEVRGNYRRGETVRAGARESEEEGGTDAEDAEVAEDDDFWMLESEGDESGEGKQESTSVRRRG